MRSLLQKDPSIRATIPQVLGSKLLKKVIYDLTVVEKIFDLDLIKSIPNFDKEVIAEMEQALNIPKRFAGLRLQDKEEEKQPANAIQPKIKEEKQNANVKLPQVEEEKRPANVMQAHKVEEIRHAKQPLPKMPDQAAIALYKNKGASAFI